MSQFVIDSAASFGFQRPNPTINLTTKQHKRRRHLLLFSANHPESLKRVAENIEAYFEEHPDRLDDLEYTLAQRREHLKLRNYCIVQNDSASFVLSPQTKFQGPCQAAFVFTGQGAQW